MYIVAISGRSPKKIGKSGENNSYPSWSTIDVNVTLPLVSTPEAAMATTCAISNDKTYGYTMENPITVSGGDFEGPVQERLYLDNLRGPNGEAITYQRTGSMPSPIDASIYLDEYEIMYKGLKKPILLYINEYSDVPPQIPIGFTCNLQN